MLRFLIALLILFAAAPCFPADPAGVWVAVGYGGRRMLSTDGRNWEIAGEWAQPGGDDKHNLIDVTYAEGRFVAVGGGGGGATGGGHVLVSKDGREWNEVLSPKNRVNPVLWQEEDMGTGRFLAGGPDRTLLWSNGNPTAGEWQVGAQLADPACTHFRLGAAGGGRFLLIGNHGGNSTPYWSATTRDGRSVEHLDTTLPAVRGLAYGAEHFVAVGPKGTRLRSADGKAWERHDAAADEDFAWVVWSWPTKEFVAGGSGTTYHSADGATWEPWPTRIPCHVLCITDRGWIGTSWPGKMWFSADGKTWERSPPLTANGINAAAFGWPSK